MIIKKKIANNKQYVDFHFEYMLESQRYELDGEEYTGYGVSVKMVDEHGTEETASVQDITSNQKVAYTLLQSLKMSCVSPMCLKIFVADFLMYV